MTRFEKEREGEKGRERNAVKESSVIITIVIVFDRYRRYVYREFKSHHFVLHYINCH